jgi:hypothetical protein
VDLFRELLWAEAHGAGVGPALISVPGAINVSDGGVDAEITGVPAGTSEGLLFPGLTRYQIKTGAFSAGNDSELKVLFLKEKSTTLKDRVRSCFEKNGTFVVVLFGSDTPDRTDNELARACQEYIGRYEPAFRDRPIRVIRQNQLAGFINRHVALANQAQLKRFPNLRIHAEWGRELESLAPLRVGPPQEAFIKQIQSELRQPVTRHLCIWGEPGIGKTRLAYEATGAEDLSSSVAYFRSPQALEQSEIIDELVHDDSKSAIVVVDDCESRDRESIWRQLKGLGTRVRLITVQHDPSHSSGTTVALQTPELPPAQISEIIQQHGVAKDAADRFAEYCGGSPRVADVVGWNLQNNPNDLTRPLETNNVWNRFIEGPDPPSGDLVARRKLVLSYLALFQKFGYGQPYQNEAKAVAAQVAIADPAITWANFQEIVRLLRQRRILQGETTLYITPKLLHIKLWSDWWDLYGENFSAQQFLGAIPDTLHEWFYDMFAYAHGSATISKTVRKILSVHGSFFRQGLLKTEVGANFFLNLTEADTEAALEFVEATIGKESRDELLSFTDGRQRVVWALEKIAVERPLFQRAARVLLRLAETESDHSIANNATGTFAGLFSLGPGKTAPTQAPPVERLPVLREAIASLSPETRSVALRACDQALRSNFFSRTYGAERRGLKDLDLWSPKTYGEWFDAYRDVWQLLSTHLSNLSGEELSEAGRILLKHAPELVQVEALADVITSTVRGLVDVPAVSRKATLETALDVLEQMKSLPEPTRSKWEDIRLAAAGGNAFQSRLRSQLVLPAWRLASDDGLTTEPWRPLAEEAIANPDEFLAQLDWLATNEAEGAGPFGYELGRLDRGLTFKEPIIEAIGRAGTSPNTGLLGGYLRALHELDASKWLSIVQELSKGPESKRLFPAVVMQSGLTDEAAAVLTELVRRGEFPAYYLQGFIFGGEIRNLSPNAFALWISLLVAENDQRATIAGLKLLHHYGKSDRLTEISPELIEAVLLHNTLFEKERADSRGSHHDFDWAEVTREFLREHPEKRLAFAKKLLESMGHDTVVLSRFGHSYTRQLLGQIARELPSEVWVITAPLLGPPIDWRANTIKDWLQGGAFSFGGRANQEAILNSVPRQNLWDWVDKDIEGRAWYLASFVPKFTADLKIPEVSRELLIRYGDRDDVQRNLIANFSSEGWAGPESEHYRTKKEALERLLEAESDPRVREWLNLYAGRLRRSIEQARTEEERENF